MTDSSWNAGQLNQSTESNWPLTVHHLFFQGCRNFQIFKRNDPKAVEKCQAMEGIVVQEYAYHQN